MSLAYKAEHFRDLCKKLEAPDATFVLIMYNFNSGLEHVLKKQIMVVSIACSK